VGDSTCVTSVSSAANACLSLQDQGHQQMRPTPRLLTTVALHLTRKTPAPPPPHTHRRTHSQTHPLTDAPTHRRTHSQTHPLTGAHAPTHTFATTCKTTCKTTCRVRLTLASTSQAPSCQTPKYPLCGRTFLCTSQGPAVWSGRGAPLGTVSTGSDHTRFQPTVCAADEADRSRRGRPQQRPTNTMRPVVGSGQSRRIEQRIAQRWRSQEPVPPPWEGERSGSQQCTRQRLNRDTQSGTGHGRVKRRADQE
jgi:hypothetical protein